MGYGLEKFQWMKVKIVKVILSLVIIAFINVSYKAQSVKKLNFGLEKVETVIPEDISSQVVLQNVLSLEETEVDIARRALPPFTGKSFTGFKEALGYKESRGNYFVINQIGYLGKYQFGSNTLKAFGVYDTSKFLNNPELQEKVFLAYMSRNKAILKNEIDHFTGKVVNGVLVTESGILAAAHLGGAGNVKKFLSSKGSNVFRDANGTSVKFYMKKFAGYDVSFIHANRNARIRH